MGVPDAASAPDGAREGHTAPKLRVWSSGDAQEGDVAPASAALGSPTWTDRDDRSGRTETTSAASDEEDEQDGGGSSSELHGEGPSAFLDVKGAAESTRGFRDLLRSMQCQLAFLQSMTQKIARDGKAQAAEHDPDRQATREGDELRSGSADAALASSSPDVTVRASPLELEPSTSPPSITRSIPKPCQSWDESVVTHRRLQTPVPVVEDAAVSNAEPEAESAIDADAPDQETRALQVEVQQLRAELAAARQENARLASAVHRLGISSVAALPDARVESGNVFLDLESPTRLEGHEACQQRAHELWESIRTLALYVRRYSVEKDAMRAQRDEAEREAERAWAQNAALAGSRNPQQKIKYLQQLKTDNGALRRKIRELEALLVGQSVAVAASPSLVEPPDASSLDASPSVVATAPPPPTEGDGRGSILAPTLLAQAGSRGERERDTVLRRLWRHEEHLRARIERLERQRPTGTPSGRRDAAAIFPP